MNEPWHHDPKLLRQRIRSRQWDRPTAGLCEGFVQANLVIVPDAHANDFHLFCQRNPQPCPLLEMTAAGDPVLRKIAHSADLRTDLPAYRVFEKGQCVAEAPELSGIWRDDLVAFLLGCSHTFDAILHREGFHLPHHEQHKTPCVFTTKLACRSAGIFTGPLVVSARAIPEHRVEEACALTARYPLAHGAPVHVGDASESLGVADLTQSEYGGTPLELGEDDVPVFWACGVTPQAVAVAAKIPFMITHKPGHMFVSDITLDDIADVGHA
jgi:uncharacterized protein YcsI (UPF0317 family)